MQQHIVRVESVTKITHDVLRIVTDKPEGYQFHPGQATEIAINKTGWQEQKRPFTFTCLADNIYLEFTIKTYPEKKGVTNELLHLKQNDTLILHDVFGAIAYKGEGTFIAGGAGITPFISIFRDLQSKNVIGNNRLLFANKTKTDIILENEFKEMLGNAFVNILSDEELEGYHHGMIDELFLKNNIKNFQGHFYVCGPPGLMEAISKQLTALGVDDNLIIKEAM
jgi:ferredoxin-NADP reductase